MWYYASVHVLARVVHGNVVCGVCVCLRMWTDIMLVFTMFVNDC